jgi:hypothetical protein
VRRRRADTGRSKQSSERENRRGRRRALRAEHQPSRRVRRRRDRPPARVSARPGLEAGRASRPRTRPRCLLSGGDHGPGRGAGLGSRGLPPTLAREHLQELAVGGREAPGHEVIRGCDCARPVELLPGDAPVLFLSSGAMVAWMLSCGSASIAPSTSPRHIRADARSAELESSTARSSAVMSSPIGIRRS